MATAILRRALATNTPSVRGAYGNNFVFLGAPGVGKGTFAGRFAPMLGVPAISTGDIIRAEIKAGSKVGLAAREFTSSGRLVPDEVVSAMVRERLQRADAQGGWILDGYPRTVQQARDLDAAQDVSRVINITLPERVLVTKLLGRRVCGDCGKNYNVAAILDGPLDMPPLLPKPADCERCKGAPRLTVREDDTAAVVEERMRVYYEQTAPLIDYYSKQGRLQDFAVQKGVADMPRLIKELTTK